MKRPDVRASEIDGTLAAFERTTDEIFSLDELRQRLGSGKQLVMKYGVDVTAPDLHIGHAVNLWMYRQLQELGHKLVFLIGDFTTQIGDPTGKNKLRPVIPLEDIRRNADEFIRQAKMVVHDDPEVMEIRRNSEWFGAMPARELLSLMSMVTHDRLMARDMFRRRAEEGKEIYEHELIYPILQGYDSVMLDADLTVIGSDQLYNEMMGRFYQEKFGKKPQVVVTTKITPGIDGREKQSKSLGNYIGLNHSPRDKFGRIMTVPDVLMDEYFRVYTDLSGSEIERLSAEYRSEPRELKAKLAEAIVTRYHGREVAAEEEKWFRETFSERKTPTEMPSVVLPCESVGILEVLLECFASQGGSRSNSELRRLLAQGGVRVDGETVRELNQAVTISPSGTVVQVGKRNWFRVTSKS